MKKTSFETPNNTSKKHRNKGFLFKNLRTSTQISLKFTLFTILQVLLFSLLVNGIFFQNRYNKEARLIAPKINNKMMQKMVLGKNRTQETEIFNVNSLEGQALLQLQRRRNISKVDDMYFIYQQLNDQILVANVTQHMIVQKNLILISLYLMLLFGVIAYILSLFFIKTSFKKLNTLLGFLDKVHIDNLNKKIEIKGHPDDEVNRISEKFNEAFEKIHKQTLSLRDFVTNASHELKTPLMSMSTEVDYTLKTKKYKQGLNNLKQQLKQMDNLLETLVTISKIEAEETFPKEQTDISEFTAVLIQDIQKIHHEKKIKLTIYIEKNVFKNIYKNSRNIIIKNILENAYKFTPEGGNIEIKLDNKKLIISDTGKGISSKDLKNIWERFRQADKSKTDTKSFGLGLYLVKLLVKKHGWKIAITSKIGKGTSCTITF